MCRHAHAGLERLVHRTPVRDLHQPFPLPVAERAMKMYDTIQSVDAHGPIGTLCLVTGVHGGMRERDHHSGRRRPGDPVKEKRRVGMNPRLWMRITRHAECRFSCIFVGAGSATFRSFRSST